MQTLLFCKQVNKICLEARSVLFYIMLQQGSQCALPWEERISLFTETFYLASVYKQWLFRQSYSLGQVIEPYRGADQLWYMGCQNFLK